eukprot:351140-Chlamydomonas_euryale.AAC.16
MRCPVEPSSPDTACACACVMPCAIGEPVARHAVLPAWRMPPSVEPAPPPPPCGCASMCPLSCLVESIRPSKSDMLPNGEAMPNGHATGEPCTSALIMLPPLPRRVCP